MLEALMLICFGVSWPASIYRTIKAKSVKGKSVIFLWLVFVGYICGLSHKLLNNPDYVTPFYAINGIMVFIDLLLYYRHAAREGSS